MNHLIYLTIIFTSNNLFAHGSIELIECHNSESSYVLRGKATDKNNNFDFTEHHTNSKRNFRSVKANLSDTVENSKLIENIKFDIPKWGKAHLKIYEIPQREIRNGKGLFKIAGKKDLELSCYAVY